MYMGFYMRVFDAFDRKEGGVLKMKMTYQAEKETEKKRTRIQKKNEDRKTGRNVLKRRRAKGRKVLSA